MAQTPIYRSMQGKEVDINKLINQNEMTVAVGNVKVNARGDELGPGGQIIRKHEDVIKSAQLIPNQISSRNLTTESVVEPVVPPTPSTKTTKSTAKDVSNMDPEGNE